MAVPRNRDQLAKLGVTPAQLEWRCGYHGDDGGEGSGGSSSSGGSGGGGGGGGGGGDDYDDDEGALDVAIHMRRGDLYESASEDDASRYFSMEYYHKLLRRIVKAWEGSPAVQAKYPRIRFHVSGWVRDRSGRR